jgi:tRNA pseudouridine13 synthase
LYQFSELARAYVEPPIKGRIKSSNADFVVEEIMPVAPSGQGEHLWLHIEKNGCNTDWLAQQLARVSGVKAMAVSYAGMKDRHAITTQWFSVHLPGQQDPDLSSFESEEVKILQSCRHDKKLKRGTLSGNRFKLCIRELSGSQDELQQRLELIKRKGVPNYFGEQRFGFGMNNLNKAELMFERKLKRLKKHQRGLYLSSARSWIFNQVLSERIQQSNWNQYLSGDVFMLEGKSACFIDDGGDVEERLSSLKIHPTGCLWGEGESLSSDKCLYIEQNIASGNPLLCKGLEDARLKQERRALRLVPANLSWQIEQDNILNIEFELPAGTFATMVLREFVETVNDTNTRKQV